MEKKSPCHCRFFAASFWLHTHWQCGTPFLAVYTTFFLLLFVYPQGTPLFWIWMCLPVYFVHQCEEYLWPGGFMEMLTHRSVVRQDADPDIPVLSEREAYWINVGIIWVLFPASAVAAMIVDPIWGLWVPCFTLLNGLSHVIVWIRDHHYNPGLVASLFLNIPVGTAAIIILRDADHRQHCGMGCSHIHCSGIYGVHRRICNVPEPHLCPAVINTLCRNRHNYAHMSIIILIALQETV